MTDVKMSSLSLSSSNSNSNSNSNSASTMLNTSNNNSGIMECCVCFKSVEMWSLGACDHGVCHECSTRMRVLCGENHCPICRHHLDRVIFMSKYRPYKDVESQVFKPSMQNVKYNIFFIDVAAKEAFQKLLEHHCKVCGGKAKPFDNFISLKEHMQREHTLFYCDLCVDNLKIFTHERKTYDRAKLALHRREGDPDDKSHKGHPLCKFCDIRYMDTDELYRHLRKEHLFCHICDTDGFHHYYGTHTVLRNHFRDDHFLCEEGECGDNCLTGVFRSEIDLKAHKAAVHGKGLSKSAAKQARTLEVQFLLTPRPRGAPMTTAAPEIRDNEPCTYVPSREEPIDMESTEQFPTLGDSSGPIVTMNRPTSMIIRQSSGALARTEENFPSLTSDMPSTSSTPTFRVNITHQPGPSNAIIRPTPKPNLSIHVHNSAANRISITETTNKQLPMKMADMKKNTEKKSFEDEFPSLSKKDRALLESDYYTPLTNCSAVVKKTPVVTAAPVSVPARPIMFQHKPPPPTLEAFPALTPTAGPAAATQQPQWIKITKAKEKAKPNKVAPAPDLSAPTDFTSSFEFPILQVSKKSDKKKNEKAAAKPKDTQPINTPNNNTSTANSNNNKEGKKKKNKAENLFKPEVVTPVETETKAKKSDKENMKSAAAVLKKNLANELLSKDLKENNNHVVNDIKTAEVTNAKPKNFTLQDNFPSLAPSRGITGFKATNNKPATLSFARPKPSQPAPASHSSVPPCDGLTFTNSSGQSYNVPVHYYIQPAEFSKRNKLLISVFMKILEGSDMVLEFKRVSRLFRDGEFSGEDYYNVCKKTMAKDFNSIFPELLVLLPDIGKQQELYKVYSTKCKSDLVTCLTCGQILVPIDLVDHMDAHKIPTDFPALGPPQTSRKK